MFLVTKIDRSWKVFRTIQPDLNQLSSHLNAYQEYHQKLGKSLGTTQNHYNSSSQEFKKIDKDITKITSGESQLKLEAETTETIEKSEV